MAIRTILVATDFSDGATRAVEVAAELAESLGARLHLLHVLHLPIPTLTPEVPIVPLGYWQDLVARSEAAVAEEQGRLEARGLRVSREVIEDVPSFAIGDAAKRGQADLIVMGSRGLTGVKHAVFGSVAERTMRTAPCPVLIVKADAARTALRNVLVALDFSTPALHALELARELALQSGPAHLILVHAYHIPIELEPHLLEQGEPALEHLSREVVGELEAALTGLKAAGLSAEYVARRGTPDQIVLELAKEREVDLIAMGTHGRRGLSHLLLGSVAERVVRGAVCPVLTTRG